MLLHRPLRPRASKARGFVLSQADHLHGWSAFLLPKYIVLKSRQFREAYGRSSALNWNIQPGARKDPEGEVTYHKDIGLPNSFSQPKGLNLKYAEHATDRAREKGVDMPRTLPPSYQIIEVTMNGRRVMKWLVRFPVSPEWDAVMPILPDGTVKTAWLNAKNDLHTTLDKSKFAAKPSF